MEHQAYSRRIAAIGNHLNSSSNEEKFTAFDSITSQLVASPTSGTYPGGILKGQVAIITGSGQGIG